jgi:hypothetical protein
LKEERKDAPPSSSSNAIAFRTFRSDSITANEGKKEGRKEVYGRKEKGR